MTTKTDNANLPAKLELRRYFLMRYHAKEKPIRVLDCCQGSGRIWSTLAREFPIQSWGLDLKPKRGRLKLDSARVIAAGGWTETVVDIDTYGLPWSHWLSLLEVCRHPVTVFLTLGMVRMGGGGQLSKEMLQALGVTFSRLSLSPSLSAQLHELATAHALHARSAHGLALQEAMEAPNRGGNARYFGVRLGKSSGKNGAFA